MKSRGEISGITFKRNGFNIYNQGIEYELRYGKLKKLVYVVRYSDLKEEVQKLLTGDRDAE